MRLSPRRDVAAHSLDATLLARRRRLPVRLARLPVRITGGPIATFIPVMVFAMVFGLVITAAAVVIVVVFAGFAGGGERIVQLVGLALAVAVVLDAPETEVTTPPPRLDAQSRTS
jgi:hypothetical protein